MTRLLIFGLVSGLSVLPLNAQSLNDAISRAATEVATQPAQSQRSEGIPRGLLWTGIGLLAGGALYLAIGATAGDDTACVSIGTRVSSQDCTSIRTVALVTGSVLSATGGTLLGIGIAKSHHSPSISFVPNGVVARQRIFVGKRGLSW
jgi:hypothetical protein